MSSFKRALTITLLAFAHFAATVVLTLGKFGKAIELLVERQSPSFADLLLDRSAKFLQLPLVTLAQQAPRETFAGLLSWIPFALNSLLWACVIVWAAHWWRQRMAAARPDLTSLPPDAAA